MKKFIYALAVSLIAMPGFILAQDKPTPAEAKKVVDYYFNGKGQGVVPIEYKFCKEVALKGENQNECVSEIPGKTVKQGDEAYLWMNFVVPTGEEPKILLQYFRDNMVRDTDNVSLRGAVRYRTWMRIPTTTMGDWKVRLFQEMADTDLAIGEIEYSVSGAGQNPSTVSQAQ